MALELNLKNKINYFKPFNSANMDKNETRMGPAWDLAFASVS